MELNSSWRVSFQSAKSFQESGDRDRCSLNKTVNYKLSTGNLDFPDGLWRSVPGLINYVIEAFEIKIGWTFALFHHFSSEKNRFRSFRLWRRPIH